MMPNLTACAIAMVLALALLACSPEAREAQARLDWKSLADGSRFAISEPTRGDEGGAIRCWPKQAGYDCLSIYEGQWREALRQGFTALPSTLGSMLDRATAGSGYRCALEASGPGYQEEIRDAKSAKLTSHVHTALDVEPGWTRAFVERYFEDNSVRPRTFFFECAVVQAELQKGSIATLGTTSLSHDLVTGGHEDPPMPVRRPLAGEP